MRAIPASARHQRSNCGRPEGSRPAEIEDSLLLRARVVTEHRSRLVETFQCSLSGHAATACYCAGAPIATGRTGEPASPCARNGRMMVHDNHTLSLASAPRLAF